MTRIESRANPVSIPSDVERSMDARGRMWLRRGESVVVCPAILAPTSSAVGSLDRVLVSADALAAL